MAGTPIKLTLYDSNDEPIKELSRTVVPWGLLKKAIRLAGSMNQQAPTVEDIDNLAGLVAGVFGDQVSIQELDSGADITDMLSVMNQIITKAGSLMPPNPTQPGN